MKALRLSRLIQLNEVVFPYGGLSSLLEFTTRISKSSRSRPANIAGPSAGNIYPEGHRDDVRPLSGKSSIQQGRRNQPPALMGVNSRLSVEPC
jgi:hypothetical protein